MYKSGCSIKEIAKELAISEQKARKILITTGLYTTPEISHAVRMHESGKSVEEIAKELSISRKAVLAMLPYSKGEYNSDTPSKNATAIRRFRERKENND